MTSLPHFVRLRQNYPRPAPLNLRAAIEAELGKLRSRIKPGAKIAVGGLLKMTVVGLGKRAGAAAMHLAASEHGHERAIRTMAGVLIRASPLLGGVAIIENQFHETAKIVVVPSGEMATGEDALLVEA